MSKLSFQRLCAALKHHLEKNVTQGARSSAEALELDCQVAVFHRTMAAGEYLDIMISFGISGPSVFMCIRGSQLLQIKLQKISLKIWRLLIGGCDLERNRCDTFSATVLTCRGDLKGCKLLLPSSRRLKRENMLEGVDMLFRMIARVRMMYRLSAAMDRLNFFLEIFAIRT
eukprot:IDg4743t1